MHVGEAARAMKIAEEYGQRLDRVADNLQDGSSLGTLVASYPSHGFVIDMKEASELFKRVRQLTDVERALCDELGPLARHPSTRLEPVVYYLSDAPKTAAKADDNDTQQADRTDSAGQKPGAEGAAEPAAPAAQTGEAATGEVVQFRNTGTAGS